MKPRSDLTSFLGSVMLGGGLSGAGGLRLAVFTIVGPSKVPLNALLIAANSPCVAGGISVICL